MQTKDSPDNARVRSPHRVKLVIAAVSVVLAGFFGALGACSSGDNPELSGGGPPTPPPGDNSCNPPTQGCVCNTVGETRQCGIEQGVVGNQITCMEGTMQCGRNNQWGPCIGSGEVTTHAFPMGGIHIADLGADAGTCNNPCDPYCQQFADTPVGLDAGADSGLAINDSGLTLAVSPNPPPNPCTGINVVPDSGTITLTSLNPSPLPTFQFQANYVPPNCSSGTDGGAAAQWSVLPASVAQIDSTGNVTVVNTVAGTLSVKAYARTGGDAGLSFSDASLTVAVNLPVDTSNAPSGVTGGSFSGSTSGNDGLSMLYPYPNTVFPLGIIPPTLQWSTDGGVVTGINIINPGSGGSYTSAPTVTISGAGGSGATAVANVTAGLGAPTVTAGGSGYTGQPSSWTFTGSGGTGSGATVQTAYFNITNVTMTSAGNYGPAPVLTATGGGASTNATITGTINGSVTSIGTVSTGGSYSTLPYVTFPGGTTSATGTVTGGITSATLNAYSQTFNNASWPPQGTLGWSTTASTPAGWTSTISAGTGTVVPSSPIGTYSGITALPTPSGVTSLGNGVYSVTSGGGSGYTANAICLATVTPTGGTWARNPLIEVQIGATGSVTGYAILDPGSNTGSVITGGTVKPSTSGGNNCGSSGTGATTLTLVAADQTSYYSPYVNGVTFGTAGSYVANGATVAAPTFTQLQPTGAPKNQWGGAGTTTLAISSIAVTNGGSGYTANSTTTLNGGVGTAATLSSTVANVTGPISTFTFTSGSNYTSLPTGWNRTGGGAQNTAATFTETMSMTSVTMSANGSGYVTPVTCSVSGGGATTNATLACNTLTGGVLNGVTITNGGTGYPPAPTSTVTFSNSGVTNAAVGYPVVTGSVAKAVEISLLYPQDGHVFSWSQVVPEMSSIPTQIQPAAARATFCFLNGVADQDCTQAAATWPIWSAFAQSVISSCTIDSVCSSATGYIKLQRLDTNGTLYPPLFVPIRFATNQLVGTAYYNSYGTNYAYNLSGTYAGNWFGGATLQITPGARVPTPIEGFTSDPTANTGCRVCHNASPDGTRLITQLGTSYRTSETLPLPTTGWSANAANTQEQAVSTGDFGFAAIFNDSSRNLHWYFTNNFCLAGACSGGSAALYNATSPAAPTAITVTNMPTFTAGLPAVAPNGSRFAFNYMSGSTFKDITGTTTASGDGLQLGVLDLNVTDAGGGNWSYAVPDGGARVVAKPGVNGLDAGTSGTVTNGALFPSFMPDNNGIVFEYETFTSQDGSKGYTRSNCDSRNTPSSLNSGSAICQYEGGHGELWWTTSASNKQSNRLNCAMGISDTNCPNTTAGTSYLPPHVTYAPPYSGTVTVPSTYGADWNLDYEPTVLPTAAGGYAWVIFTSRRQYGNIATINPFWSDPRFEDLRYVATTKKLWVAAIDLNPTPGTDPSHPAFYLDGQELLAGNSRGFLVLNACKSAYASGNPNASLCTSNLDCCAGEICQLDNPLPSPPTSHCQTAPTNGCYGPGVPCTSAQPCCDPLAVCSQQSSTCVEPPPLPYFQQANFVRQYSNPCPSGQRPYWQNFVYGTSTPSDSSIVIYAETTNDPTKFTTTDDAGAANPGAPLVKLATVSGSDVTFPNGTANVNNALETAGDVSGLYLQITVQFIPSSDGHSAPLLTQWEQQFDCVDAQ
jgi:hypothetical protein